MKRDLPLIVTSLLSTLLLTFHLTQDTLYARAGTDESLGSTLVAAPVLALFLYGTLVLAERRLGYLIMLVESLAALAMPLIHLQGPMGALTRPGRALNGEVATSAGAFLFFWTLMALGVTGTFALLRSLRGLLSQRSGQPR